MVFYIILAAVVGLGAYVRLAPSDPTRWHVDPGTIPVTGCTQLTTARNSAKVSCLRDLDPVAALAELDTIALATPRTTRLAGSAETGRITWVTRSRLIGFPDYTTAQTSETPEGTRLDVFARQRFGDADLGVNTARLSAWMADLQNP